MARRLVKHTYVTLVTRIMLTIRYWGFRLVCVSCFVMPSSLLLLVISYSRLDAFWNLTVQRFEYV